MKLYDVIFLKMYRNGLLIDWLFMFIIVFLVLLKNSFLFYILMPVFIGNKIFNIVWHELYEKNFYLQFSSKSLRKVDIIQLTIYVISFNTIYFIEVVLFSCFNKVNFIFLNWCCLNIYISTYVTLSYFLFERIIAFKIILKYSLIVIVSILVSFYLFYINQILNFEFIYLITLIILLYFNIHCRKYIKQNNIFIND
jgi:hypothetical protein